MRPFSQGYSSSCSTVSNAIQWSTVQPAQGDVRLKSSIDQRVFVWKCRVQRLEQGLQFGRRHQHQIYWCIGALFDVTKGIIVGRDLCCLDESRNTIIVLAFKAIEQRDVRTWLLLDLLARHV